MLNDIKSRFPFSSFIIKMVALITMVIDHLGLYLYSFLYIDDITHEMLRQIGRISFVLFAFMVANSMLRSSNKERYILRLFIFGIGIDIFNIALDLGLPINIFITLGLGALACYLFELKGWWKLLCIVPLLIPFNGVVYFDYSFYGVGLIFIFYLLKTSRFWQSIALVGWNALILWIMPLIPMENGQFPEAMRSTQFLSILAIPFIVLYNERKGYSSKFVKWFFYFFYPLHLVILELLFTYVLKGAN